MCKQEIHKMIKTKLKEQEASNQVKIHMSLFQSNEIKVNGAKIYFQKRKRDTNKL